MTLAGTYDVIGPADGPVVVFVHGTRLNRAAWLYQVERLRGELRCVTLDLPGHGALADAPFRIDDAADHVTAVSAAAAPGRRPILVGLSLGGYVAVQAAARHPDAFTGLVLAGCSADPVGCRGLAFRLFARVLRHLPVRLLHAGSDALLRHVYEPRLADAVDRAGYGFGGGGEAVAALVGHRFSERLRAFDGPVLVVNGALDPVFGPPAGRWLGRRPAARRVVLRRAGHLSNFDRPAAFAELVRTFARSAGQTVDTTLDERA
jgi:pimeloyl-ACP methyl ester carboxylesterase